MSKHKRLPTVQDIIRNTGFKTESRAQAVLETLKWLEEGAPHKFDGLPGKYEFDMGLFISHDDIDFKKRPDPECGTSCCIAGAIRMYERDGKTFKGGEPNKSIDALFETEKYPQLQVLFYARYSDMSLTNITARGAAKTLRRYINTGCVTWKRDEQ